jgi:hypothetical protein
MFKTLITNLSRKRKPTPKKVLSNRSSSPVHKRLDQLQQERRGEPGKWVRLVSGAVPSMLSPNNDGSPRSRNQKHHTGPQMSSDLKVDSRFLDFKNLLSDFFKTFFMTY